MLRKKLITKIIIKILIWLVVVYLLFNIFIDGFLNDFLADFIYNYNSSLYYFFVDNKILFIMSFIICLFIFILIYSIRKLLKYFSLICDSIDKVLLKEEDLIVFPDEIRVIADKLNTLKLHYIQSEQAAKEAESKKNDLIVYMAHDLKTPLTSIIGYLSLLKDEKEISPALQEKYISIALNKSERLEDLINEFFDITRFNLQNIHLTMQKINLTYLLEQLVDEGFPMLEEKHLTYQLSLCPSVFIQADGNQLARVFENLLKNAIHYSYENTAIHISLTQQENGVCVSFENMAPKIPEHKIEKIFEKFYRLDDSRSSSTGGAGLGLAIAKQIVELHHGQIFVTSDEEYTTFTVILPN